MKRSIWGTIFRALFLCVLPLAISAAPVHAAEETEYIVKYKEGTRTDTERAAPFEVVSETEMRLLRDAGALEWYEEDIEIPFNPDPPWGEGDFIKIPEGDAETRAGEEAALMDWYASAQWNLEMVSADAAFESNYLGQGIRVGVLDSGVNPHPALADNLRPGHNYISNTPDPSDTSDTYGHGTKVAGLIAGAAADGYIGIAPKAMIVPLKITDGRSIKISVICNAIYGGVDDYGCDILNLSLGVSTDYNSMREAIAHAEEKGVLVVAAAGNDGKTGFYYPAAYDSVIGVGSVNRDGTWYSRSTHNASVFLTAPGVNVRSTFHFGGFATGTGTSFATPQVTAAAAVLLSANPTLSPADTMRMLAESASDRGAEGYDEYYGHGILNLEECVKNFPAVAEDDVDALYCFLPRRGMATAIWNRTDQTLNCVYFLAEYNSNGRLRTVTVRRLEIPAFGQAEIPLPEDNVPSAQIVCDAQTFVPLISARKF